jgi:ABC-type multidrug transport system ATPase subunit
MEKESKEQPIENDFIEGLVVDGENSYEGNETLPGIKEIELTEDQMEALKKTASSLQLLDEQLTKYTLFQNSFPIEIRISNFGYKNPINVRSNKIQTVYNSSLIYKIVKFFKRFGNDTSAEGDSTKTILDDISLVLKPGKMYLVLGPPGSGKSSLLKAVSGRLSVHNGESVDGCVSYNGKTMKDATHFHIDNAIAFVDQLDRHAPRLTVNETFEFSFQCKRGGTHMDMSKIGVKEARKQGAKADAERLLVCTTEESLGLDHVKDTFVGNDVIRGVSGGQRRRVTIGEMVMNGSPILCGDEISNGLDATSTFEMIQTFMQIGKIQKRTHVISLLQPSPETVSLFDEVILLAEGKLLYAGPISEVEQYFASLGYRAPDYLDTADFLQLLATPDAQKVFEPTEARQSPYNASELAELFRSSAVGRRIQHRLVAPLNYAWNSACDDTEKRQGNIKYLDDKRFQKRYANNFLKSTWLILKRNLLIWTRDRRVLIANAIKNIIMGISVGGVFYQTDDVISILGVLFQGMLFIMLGMFCGR